MAAVALTHCCGTRSVCIWELQSCSTFLRLAWPIGALRRPFLVPVLYTRQMACFGPLCVLSAAQAYIMMYMRAPAFVYVQGQVLSVSGFFLVCIILFCYSCTEPLRKTICSGKT